MGKFTVLSRILVPRYSQNACFETVLTQYLTASASSGLREQRSVTSMPLLDLKLIRLQVIMMISLIILSIVLFFGGGPSHDRLGFRYWQDPGAAHPYILSGNTGYFISFWQTLVLSVFPFTFAVELLVVTGGEMESPRRNLPIAGKRYFYRLVIFYVLSVLAIGVTCPSDDSRLTDGGHGAAASPFVVAIANAGISTLPSIINAVILMSAWSSGNSFLYISSRALYSLAVQGSAPRIFKTCNRWGVPYYAVACSSLFCGLAYLNTASSGATVFNWFVNLTNTCK
jgi:yeast amino acid transporter